MDIINTYGDPVEVLLKGNPHLFLLFPPSTQDVCCSVSISSPGCSSILEMLRVKKERKRKRDAPIPCRPTSIPSSVSLLIKQQQENPVIQHSVDLVDEEKVVQSGALLTSL